MRPTRSDEQRLDLLDVRSALSHGGSRASPWQCAGMRVLVLGGTWFLGRRVVERLHERGDEVLVVHRGVGEPDGSFPPAAHLHIDRHHLAACAGDVRRFAPDAVVDTSALTGAAVDAVLPVLPDVPAVVLSSQDVYQAHSGLRAGRCEAPVPIDEGSELRRERYPYRGLGIEAVPEDYDKLDVEERWLDRGAVVLRLPLIYGPHDWQRREDIVLRRLRAGRRRIPIGAANLLLSRSHVDDLATGVLAALDTRAADGLAVNLGEPRTLPLRGWLEQILAAADSDAELVRVPEETLPVDLALTAAPAQHLLVSVTRAEQLLGWAPADPTGAVIESVRWHLDHPPPEPTWTEADAHADDHALAQA
jgi:nucleoside-diphosphate-sugar epimerase